MKPDHTAAAVADLAKELDRLGVGQRDKQQDKLAKIACFCRTALVIHGMVQPPHRRDAADALAVLAQAHQLPLDCALPLGKTGVELSETV